MESNSTLLDFKQPITILAPVNHQAEMLNMSDPISVSASHTDCHTRFIFNHSAVCGRHVRLEKVWQHIAQQKQYPTVIRYALGELLAAAVLLATNLKTDGTLIMQIQGRGRVKMLVAEATAANTCRATAHWDNDADINDNESLNTLLGKDSLFIITLKPRQGEPQQGIVPLEGENIAQMLMNHIKQSEQLDTHIVLTASESSICGGQQQMIGHTPAH